MQLYYSEYNSDVMFYIPFQIQVKPRFIYSILELLESGQYHPHCKLLNLIIYLILILIIFSYFI